ncbi:hypothetical protein SD70_12940 [Gordoniibacillus kamchatkensis]|uniref:Ger(X)C family spore germination protein n=1 Tax=Gordoniibacillus kamchatkensis TaxID=1590651 RepID=A0ABR5AHE1_9BACL|nr:Ger(x)C family spore germination protein [Paenibacillus sp. VKM B-2647]KIL40483.1 hypothetical protein SD70_12940 [Paenibacillus sp. VKM B-2647]
MRTASIILCFCLLVTSGCTTKAFKDIDRRFFVLALGVDKSKEDSNKYRVTLKLGIPSPKIEPGKAKSQIISQESESVSDAIRLLKSKVDKELDFGHTKMLVIGEALAKEDVTSAIDFFIRRRDIQNIAFMAVGSPDAEAVLKITPKSERLPANALFLSFDELGTESSFIITEYLFDFYRRMTEKGLDPYLPVVQADSETYIINRIGVFDKTRMKLMLSPKESAILNELARNIQKFHILTRTKDTDFSLSVEKFNRKFVFDPQDATKLHVKSEIEGTIEQSTQPIFDEDWKKYEQQTEQVAVKRYMDVLRKLQKNNVDPIGLGLIYRARHYNNDSKDWETWQKIYPNLSFDVKVDVKIEGTGVIK